MRRNKFKKIMTVLLASAALATVGFGAIACGGDDGNTGHTHKWERDYGPTSHWMVCKEDGEKKDAEPHIDVNLKDGKCDVCGATMPEQGGDDDTTGVYEITLNANGGTLGSVTKVNTANGKLAQLPNAPTAPANKTFKGWYTAATGGTKVETSTEFTANGTIYAQWNDVGGTVDPPTTDTVKVYFHKPSDWQGSWIGIHAYGADESDSESTVVQGFGEGGARMTDAGNGWYTYDVAWPDEIIWRHVIVFDENDDDSSEATKIRFECYAVPATDIYINNKGKVFNSQSAAVDDENDVPKAHSYTIYMYAPDATSVTISVWGNFGGEFNDESVMTAVSGHAGWFSYSFGTDKGLTTGNGINLNIYVDGTNKPKYTEDPEGLYFISLGGEGGFADFASAEAKYDELNNVDPSDTVSLKIYFQKPTENTTTHEWNLTGRLLLHAYGDDVGALSGGWGNTAMTAEGDGWYSVTFENVPSAYIGKTVNFIFCDESNNTEAGFGRVVGTFTLDAAGVWISSTGATVNNPNA